MNLPTWWTPEDSKAWDKRRSSLRRQWKDRPVDSRNGTARDSTSGNEVGAWEEVEGPIGYGCIAHRHFADRYPAWSEALERELERDWNNEPSWSHVRVYVRHGYELGPEEPRSVESSGSSSRAAAGGLPADQGYGASHGYKPGHDGPSGPGDAPAIGSSEGPTARERAEDRGSATRR